VFVKQYCGTWTHAIYYSGVLDETGRVITGQWGWAPDQRQNDFELRKVDEPERGRSFNKRQTVRIDKPGGRGESSASSRSNSSCSSSSATSSDAAGDQVRTEQVKPKIKAALAADIKKRIEKLMDKSGL
jgi:hypothetical protein